MLEEVNLALFLKEACGRTLLVGLAETVHCAGGGAAALGSATDRHAVLVDGLEAARRRRCG